MCIRLTQISRDRSGDPVAIITPDLQSFGIQLDPLGNLAKVTYPTGEFYQMLYRTGGLLTDFIKPNGVGTHYDFDGVGRLAKATDPAGGWQRYIDFNNGSSRQTREGVSTNFFSRTLSHGQTESYISFNNAATRIYSDQGYESSSYPEGHYENSRVKYDNRLGGMTTIPYTSFFRSSLALTTTNQVTTERNYNSLNSLFDFSFTDSTYINNYGFVATTYQSSSRTWNRTTAEGRKSLVQTDLQTRPVVMQNGNDIPVELSYDSRGRLSKMTQGNRVTEMQYDQYGFMTSIKNPLGQTTTLTNNASGRTLASINAKSENTQFNYDNNGNLSSITNALGILHELTYSLVDLLSVYQAPDVPGAGRQTKFIYNFDKQLAQKINADGRTLSYSYIPSTGHLLSITGSDGSRLSATYYPQKSLVQSLSTESASIS